MKRRVVVTGIGALTPIGNNVNDTWKGILNHQCGIDLIQSFDTSNMKVKVAGELKNFEATEYSQVSVSQVSFFYVYIVKK